MTGSEMATIERPRSATVPAREWALIEKQAQALASSDIIPRDYRRKPANVVVAAITGRQYGWDVLTAMRNGHVIEGTWGMKPEAMLGLVRQAGHSVKGTMTPEGAEVIGVRCDTGDEMTISFTIEDAKRANLTGKGTWKQYPQMMCYWRAVAILCRVLFSDLTSGVHSVEELGVDIGEDGDVVEAEVVEREPQPLSDEALLAFRQACEDVGLDPTEVLNVAFEADGVPNPLTDEHLPRMRDVYRQAVEAMQADQETTDSVESPDEDVSPAEPSEGERPATRAQVGKIKGEYKRVGIEDRDAQLDKTSEMMARPVESHNDLTFEEAAAMIEAMSVWETPAEVVE